MSAREMNVEVAVPPGQRGGKLVTGTALGAGQASGMWPSRLALPPMQLRLVAAAVC
jgi:hypothetical protein